MGLEEDLTRLLAESVDELHPPVREIVAEGGRLGRRRRRVRRGFQALGAAVVAGAVVTTAAVVMPGWGGPKSTRAADGAATAPASPSAVATGQASPTPLPSTEPATAEMTWQAMLKIFSDELPPGGKLKNLEVFGLKKADTADSHHIQVEYDDGKGASTVMLTVERRSGSALGFSCSDWLGGSDEGPRKPGNEKPVCREAALPDGGRMISYITGTDVVGLYDQGVQLMRGDGVLVQIVAANATLDSYTGQEDGPPITVTRDRPPVGLAGWEAVAKSSRWQLLVPQSVVDAGVEFAKGVSHMPCPIDAKKVDCQLD